MTLKEVPAGKETKIRYVHGEGLLRKRLLEMGLTPNTIVKVRKVAPMGDPIEIYIRSYVLTLRKEDAKMIEVGDIYDF